MTAIYAALDHGRNRIDTAGLLRSMDSALRTWSALVQVHPDANRYGVPGEVDIGRDAKPPAGDGRGDVGFRSAKTLLESSRRRVRLTSQCGLKSRMG
jgi:hypothetical protein